MTKFLGSLTMAWARGETDLHYSWYYDNLYPDMLYDPDDNRYIDFRYTDQAVSPEVMTGYYPYDHLKYGKWLGQKNQV